MAVNPSKASLGAFVENSEIRPYNSVVQDNSIGQGWDQLTEVPSWQGAVQERNGINVRSRS